MRRTTTGLATALALALAVGTTALRAEDAPDVDASVEILSTEARQGAAALLDQAWLDDLVGRAGWTEFLVEAAAQAKLDALPEFAGKTPKQIGSDAASAVTIQRRDGPGVVVVQVKGVGARGPALANAVTGWIRTSAQAEAKRRLDERTAALQQRVAAADSAMRLGGLDRVNALAGESLNESTLDVDFERLLDDRRELGRAADELRRGLDLDEEEFMAFTGALNDPTKAVAALEGHARLVRDERLADLDEQIAVARGERDALAAQGFTKDSSDLRAADATLARAEGARTRHVLRAARAFVKDVEDRRARRARLEQSLARNAATLAVADAVRRRVVGISAEIDRREALKHEAVQDLERLVVSGTDHEAVRVLTVAPTK
jgi:hypothetical protein